MRTLQELIHDYAVNSEVTSGEYIYSLTFDKAMGKKEVRELVQSFLDWDESEETFDVYFKENKFWIV